jgi:CheY-like chemotaxis protein
MAAPAHVLIADDDADMREALAILLDSEGLHVVEAANGRLALDALASDPDIAVIVLDLMMPVMDGATFLAHKAKGPHSITPVVIFSASPSIGLERIAGVVSVVPKLLGIDVLLAAIRAADGLATLPRAPAGGLSV